MDQETKLWRFRLPFIKRFMDFLYGKSNSDALAGRLNSTPYKQLSAQDKINLGRVVFWLRKQGSRIGRIV